MSAQKLHIHCLFWSYIFQNQNSYGSQRHVELRYYLQMGEKNHSIHSKKKAIPNLVETGCLTNP